MTKKTTRSTAAKRAEVGRPSKYRPEYAELARKYCLLGATDAELAEYFDTSEKTVNEWKKQHPEFLQSIKDGKEVADATVADALFQRAKGYQHPDTHFATCNGVVVATPTTKHYPPDTAAGFIWLKNRRSGKWRDKQEHELTGKDGGPIETKELGSRELARRIAFVLTAATKTK